MFSFNGTVAASESLDAINQQQKTTEIFSLSDSDAESARKTRWKCKVNKMIPLTGPGRRDISNIFLPFVSRNITIWWGHQKKDAEWACYEWNVYCDKMIDNCSVSYLGEGKNS